MKNFILHVFLLINLSCYSQYITRGPDVGEIYFLGPTTNGYGLYYSTDFGETATFIDGTMDYISIAADKTKGGIYCIEYPSNLYYNDNYGYGGSWVFKSSEISSNLLISGVIPGHVFYSFYKHSEDYGANFITHSLNGYFGSGKYSALDKVDEEIGYVITYKLTQADTFYMFRTTDTFENLELIHKLDYHWSNNILLSYGSITGELFIVDFTQQLIWFSNNYGDSIKEIENFNLTDYYVVDMVGGNQLGELFILYNYINYMWDISHIYIPFNRLW